ncbi:MAG: colanic acid biosynthesis glycosyltransferase WcaI [Chloroflexi bacterium HGW-Chloroflexi-4]|jgi:colanic acid biosynthesis glycosyl transferase WcaI|nr:MAG: colanic acid biosynthesis glycosyltransferase WcaI [Chloroflexi bacterium HGW-Chloroflexi-4]
MNIIIHGLNFSPEIVGVGKYSGELARSLVEKGHHVTVVTAPPYFPQWRIQPGYSGKKWTTVYENKIKIVRCPIWVPKKVTGIRRIIHLLTFALSSSFIIINECRSKPDFVIAVEPTLFSAPFTLLACKLNHVFSWLHIQDFEVDAAIELGIIQKIKMLSAISKMFENWVHSHFDHFSTISHKMTERLIAKGVPKEKVSYFPNWVDTNLIYPDEKTNQYRQSFGFTGEDIVVLYSGSLGVKQGIEIIIEIADLLKNNLNIKFVICGDGPDKTLLQQMAEKNPNVFFLPLQPFSELNDLLNMADIHLLPQKYDASDLVMPSKLLGILSSGKPVVAGCISGSELFSIVQNIGIAVKPEDSKEYAKAIEYLAVNQDQRKLFGTNGRKLAITKFSQKNIIENFIADLIKYLSK